ncbi:uncharacterized protein LY89DRAFT_5981 [Mollisia scopiformis]|uniref:Uncharacterized protein n=1 Tax=Mollisia scopiformis TaxID=149040 RepID=A0A194XUA9_MOLSC|nr:uncharacterized protein LY89DRAFT_5981 [Mollisia scopiformis]KUJ23905.1 hypothetical protein LY89DRAFT_5981 [Mollisia scopiformis]
MSEFLLGGGLHPWITPVVLDLVNRVFEIQSPPLTVGLQFINISLGSPRMGFGLVLKETVADRETQCIIRLAVYHDHYFFLHHKGGFFGIGPMMRWLINGERCNVFAISGYAGLWDGNTDSIINVVMYCSNPCWHVACYFPLPNRCFPESR